MKSVRLYPTSLFLIALIIACETNAQSGRALKNSIDSLLSPLETNQKPGLSVALVRDGKLIYSKYTGMANIKGGVKNDSSTQFWIASVTKQFTAAAVYKLVLEKKIALNNSVRRYLSDLPALFENITVNHLIHHTSGIRDGFVLTALAKNPPSSYTNENVIRYLKTSGNVNFSPGSKYEYNNSGYVLLATIIEKVSGKTYAGYLQENIFAPLGMRSTYVSSTFPTGEKQAEGYKESGPNQFEPYHFSGDSHGSTGIITILADLARWSGFLQRPKSVPAMAPIVTPLLKTGQLSNGKTIAYAGGLEKFVYRGRSHFEHFGADEGFKADVLFFPSTNLSVIGLTNNDSYYNLLGLLYQISDLVHAAKPNAKKLYDESKKVI